MAKRKDDKVEAAIVAPATDTTPAPRILPDLTSEPKPHPLGADVVATAGDDDEEEDKKVRVAKHSYLDAGGQPTKLEEDAHAVSYVLFVDPDNQDAGTLEPVLTTWADLSADVQRMYGCFGIKTIVTNDASQIRNNKKLAPADKTPAMQRAAVVEKMALRASGVWLDRTPGEGGPRVDREKLAGAIVQVKLDSKKITQAESGDEYARVRQRLEDDAVYLKKARAMPEVAHAYNRAMGVATTTVDDL